MFKWIINYKLIGVHIKGKIHCIKFYTLLNKRLIYKKTRDSNKKFRRNLKSFVFATDGSYVNAVSEYIRQMCK